MKLQRLTGSCICILTIGTMLISCPGAMPAEPVSSSAQGLVEQLTLDNLTARSDAIFAGEVIDITYRKEAEGNIYTFITLAVDQTIKGKTEGEVVIRVFGGEIDGSRLVVEDAPQFQSGERLVVFLNKEEDDKFRVVGGFQGKFTIDENDIVSGNVPLEQFIDQIKTILK